MSSISSTIKSRPLKATIPINEVVKPGSVRTPLTPSPIINWSTKSPFEHSNSGQRSPGSSCWKGKSKYPNRDGNSEVIRRTASLDAIYLKLPKEQYYWGQLGILQIDKSTQTEDYHHDDDNNWIESKKIHFSPEILRPNFIRGNKDSSGNRRLSPGGEHTLNNSSQTLTSCFLSSPTSKLLPVKPIPTKSSLRSSVEGLNQEIERIVLRHGNNEAHSTERYESSQATPEGHRAPLAEMLKSSRSRSVNTQTPQDFSHSSGESHGSSPDNENINKLGTSPQINTFLAREPPDGCEKVRLKSLDDKRNFQLEHAPQPNSFKLRPSLGSAFKILQPSLSPSEEQIEPTGGIRE